MKFGTTFGATTFFLVALACLVWANPAPAQGGYRDHHRWTLERVNGRMFMWQIEVANAIEERRDTRTIPPSGFDMVFAIKPPTVRRSQNSSIVTISGQISRHRRGRRDPQYFYNIRVRADDRQNRNGGWLLEFTERHHGDDFTVFSTVGGSDDSRFAPGFETGRWTLVGAPSLAHSHISPELVDDVAHEINRRIMARNGFDTQDWTRERVMLCREIALAMANAVLHPAQRRRDYRARGRERNQN